MNIDDMTYGELKRIAEMFSAPAKGRNRDLGHNIAVLDRGWVYAGDCRIEDEFLVIENAQNIRRWGTKKGLGELANGPLAETKLDPSGVVKAPVAALKFLIKTVGGWS